MLQAMESDITLRENGRPETITFISTVPLFCKQNDKKCKLDMVLSVKYPKGKIATKLINLLSIQKEALRAIL